MVLSTAMVTQQDSWLRQTDHPQEEAFLLLLKAAFKQEHRDLSQTYKSHVHYNSTIHIQHASRLVSPQS